MLAQVNSLHARRCASSQCLRNENNIYNRKQNFSRFKLQMAPVAGTQQTATVNTGAFLPFASL